jgi:hypothetical protein
VKTPAPSRTAPAATASKKRPTGVTASAKTAGPKTAGPKTAPAKKLASAAGKPAKFAPRADLGAAIEPFFAKRSGTLREVLDELRGMIDAQIPGAASSIKWGMPFYTLNGAPVCALAAFKAHVNLILAGPEGTFADPDGLLEGDGKAGRHLKLRAVGEIPRRAVMGWLRAAAAGARKA